MRPLALVMLVLAGCSADPNGLWGAPDAGLAFVDWDGGAYWYPRDLILEEISFEMYVDCLSLANSSRLEYTGRAPQFLWPRTDSAKAVFEMREPFVDEGYRISHRDAQTIGPVRLIFDAGVEFEAGRALFSWSATYLDDVGVVGREGGESVFERDEASCR